MELGKAPQIQKLRSADIIRDGGSLYLGFEDAAGIQYSLTLEIGRDWHERREKGLPVRYSKALLTIYKRDAEWPPAKPQESYIGWREASEILSAAVPLARGLTDERMAELFGNMVAVAAWEGELPDGWHGPPAMKRVWQPIGTASSS